MMISFCQRGIGGISLVDGDEYTEWKYSLNKFAFSMSVETVIEFNVSRGGSESDFVREFRNGNILLPLEEIRCSSW